MAEYTNIELQTVAANQNVLFADTPVRGKCDSIIHREGSGLVTVRGKTNQCRALYKVFFNGNIAIPADGTVGPISLAIAINGEAERASLMTSTPAAVSQFNNVSSSIIIAVPNECCSQVSVKNVGTTPIDIQNANLLVERVA